MGESGASALEFALIAPPFLAVLLGLLSYGGYFWTAHSLQQLANDCARASVAGLDADEREEIARDALESQVGGYAFLEESLADVTVTDGGNDVTVAVSYDASDSAFFVLSGLIPMPSPEMSRQAVVRLGGY
jgi:Flp pilus assembly protein TadG